VLVRYPARQEEPLYPDFIILHPSRGLLFLEVKDWKIDTIRSINHQSAELHTSNGVKTVANPLEQARQVTYAVIDKLQRDPALCAPAGRFQGKLCFPYGYGVVLSNITRKMLDDSDIYEVLPEHLVLCKDEISGSMDAEAFQERLWGMFNYQFGEAISLPQIDRIRWHLFPEVRITPDLFGKAIADAKLEETLPEIIKVMDLKQEQLARSLGEGHRVIHGVAGSGKTLILGYRSLYLASLQPAI
jgi:hypothetical protein